MNKEDSSLFIFHFSFISSLVPDGRPFQRLFAFLPMIFVNPLLLAGTALVALPIVLHLVMRRKPRWVEFPALRFVRLRHDTNRRQLRLRHLLLLLLRAAIIALVAVALARPSLRVAGGILGGQKAPVAAALVIDTSKRMDYLHENRTRLDAAKELAIWLLAQFPPESQVAVITSRAESAAFQVDLGAAKHRIESLTAAADVQPALTGSIEEAVRLLSQSPLERKEIYIFSDLAKVAWPGQGASRLQERLGQSPEIGVHVIDVGIPQPANLALGDLGLSGQVVSNRSTLKVEADVSSLGIGGKHTVEIDLLEPDPKAKMPGARAPQNSGQQTIEIEPGQSQRVAFPVSGLAQGTHQGYVRILGQDGLAADDRRYFTIEVKPPWPILVAAPKPEKDYASFLTRALAPRSWRLSGRAPFQCTVVAQDELARTDLEAYAAVCLLDPKPMEAPVWQKLADFVAEGHGLAVFLGRNAEPVTSFNQGPAQDVLAGKLLRKAHSPDDSLVLAPRNLEHPVLAALRGYPVPWFRHPVYCYWQLGPLPEGVHVIASFSDDGPAILERPLGKGRAITMTTPVSDDPNRDPWNLLPAIEPWPLMIVASKMADYLVGAESQELNYYAGQTAILEIDPQVKLHNYFLTPPDGVEARLTPDLKQQRLVVTSTEQPGNYRVQAGGTAEGVDRGFSVNVRPDLTRLERHSDEELAALFGSVPYRIARNRSQIELNVSTGRVGRELFPWLILAAALVLGLEHVLANRFYRET
jgi:hypothetical protein